MADRPMDMTLTAALTIVLGAFILICGIIYAMMSHRLMNELDLDMALKTAHLLGYVTIAISAAVIIVGYGLWERWKVAWYLAMVLFALAVVVSVYYIICKQYWFSISFVIGLILITCMLRPCPREYFNI